MRASRKRRGNSQDSDLKMSDHNIAVMADTWQIIKDFFVGTPSSFSRSNLMAPLEANMPDAKGGRSKSDQPDFFFIH